jgi:hypothetical protein
MEGKSRVTLTATSAHQLHLDLIVHNVTIDLRPVIMASLCRLSVARRAPLQCRSLSTTRVLREEVPVTSAPNIGTTPAQKKPIGGFRGGSVYQIFLMEMCDDLCMLTGEIHRIVGFLFGFSLASSFAAYHLLDEYKQASAALQASVEELQISTEKVRV